MSIKSNEKIKQDSKKQLPHLRILNSTIYDSLNLSSAAFRVYIILRCRRNRITGQCNPTISRLMKDTNMSKKTVERALNELEDLGWLARESGRGMTSNRYSFPASAIITETTVDEKSGGTEKFQKTEDGETFESYAETANITDPDLRLEIDRALFWIQKQKNYPRKSFKVQKWIELLLGLHEKEMLPLFQKYYLWLENQKWVNNITPELMGGYIENFKNRKEVKSVKSSKETTEEFLERKRREYPNYPKEEFNKTLIRYLNWHEKLGKDIDLKYFDKWLREDVSKWLEENS